MYRRLARKAKGREEEEARAYSEVLECDRGARGCQMCAHSHEAKDNKNKDLQSPQHYILCAEPESKGKMLKYKLIIINSQYNLFHIRSHEMQIDRNFHTKY